MEYICANVSFTLTLTLFLREREQLSRVPISSHVLRAIPGFSFVQTRRMIFPLLAGEGRERKDSSSFIRFRFRRSSLGRRHNLHKPHINVLATAGLTAVNGDQVVTRFECRTSSLAQRKIEVFPYKT